MTNGIRLAACTSIILLAGCSDNPPPEEYTRALELLNDKWDGGCQENPRPADDPDSTAGYSRETLEIDRFYASQTIDYYQDADCSVPVTEDQVADLEETFTLRKQTQQMSLSYPFGTTTTVLGEAQHIDLSVVSVAIDDVTLTDEELAERGIELRELLGIFIVTDSDRLHIGTTDIAEVNSRPQTIPLDYSYIRAED